MLVDSSVWIDFLRGDSAAETRHLVDSLKRGDPVWLAPPILQEVLQGADTSARFDKWDRTLGELPLLHEPDQRSLTREAAKLYARCRWQAVTPRSANDCLIATYAIRFALPLLQRGRDFGDFVRIAGIEPRLVLVRA